VRKIVAYELLSLDGVAEHPDGFFDDWHDAMDANLAEVVAAQDAVILGRRSYNEWARFWPSSQVEPFATFINGVEKYVGAMSMPSAIARRRSRLSGQSWARTCYARSSRLARNDGHWRGRPPGIMTASRHPKCCARTARPNKRCPDLPLHETT
jgi:hypothetical protein